MHQCEKGPRLLADVGGTNARFGWQRAPGEPIEHVQVLPCAEFPSLKAAIESYVARAAVPRPLHAAVAIANPVCGDTVRMTNHHWSFSIEQLRQALGLQRLLVLNDFTALALALPGLPAAALRPLGGGPAVAGAAVGLIGPGTGLGVSGLVPDGQGGWIPLEGEGGHVTLAATTEREWCVVQALQRRYGHVSAERVLSGPGLRDLYAVLCEADGVAAQADTPHAVVALAQQRQDARAREAVQLFSAWLGSCAGNLALTLGARGGVYIGGGVVQRLGDVFDEAAFRERFEAKGRFAAYLAAIPVWVIMADPSPALAGAAAALDSARYR